MFLLAELLVIQYTKLLFEIFEYLRHVIFVNLLRSCRHEIHEIKGTKNFGFYSMLGTGDNSSQAIQMHKSHVQCHVK